MQKGCGVKKRGFAEGLLRLDPIDRRPGRCFANHNVFDLYQFQAIHTLIGTDAQVWPGVVPHMADPVLTALWKEHLSKVEDGSLLVATFKEQLGTWLSAQVNKVRQLEGAVPRMAAQESA
ncbi:MAG: hypothetical protein ACJA1Y_000602 [Burkholderiaceae bacterium]